MGFIWIYKNRKRLEAGQKSSTSLQWGTFGKLLLITSSRRSRIRLVGFLHKRDVPRSNGSKTANSVKWIIERFLLLAAK
jgi:hypothetical protein